MSSRNDEALLEVPAYLYKNPPKPRREDIAQLFDKLVREENEKKFYICQNNGEEFYRITNNDYLFDVIDMKNQEVYRTMNLISRHLYTGVNYIVKNPLRSKYLRLIAKVLGINKSDKLKMRIIKNGKKLAVSMIF